MSPDFMSSLRAPSPLPIRTRRKLRVWSALLLAASCPIPSSGQTVPLEALDAVFARYTGTDTPGCALGVSRPDAPVFTRAWGMADLEHGVPNTPATIFEAGSVAKQFTAAAVVLLAVEGLLSLDDDVRRWIPEVPDYGTPVTIRHLMNHTSGLRDWGSVAAIEGWGRSDRTHDHRHVLEILARQSALNYVPGEAYSYTNSGYNLLAILVERVTGESFASFSRKRIFEPLGLTSTQWRDDYRRVVPGRSSAYAIRGGEVVIDRPIEDVHGNGGLLTTVEDLLRWDEALRTGALGGPRFVEEMHRPGVLNDGRTIDYASGLQVGSYRGVPRVSHTGSTSGYRAFLARFPEQGLVLALLCNVGSVNPGAVGNQVADLFLGDLPEVRRPAPPRAVPVPEGTLRDREGLYRNARSGEPMRLVRDGGALRVEAGPPLRALSREEFQVGEGERRFRFPAAAGPVASFEEFQDGFRVAIWERVEGRLPGLSELQAMAGLYHSEDAAVTLELRVEEGQAVLYRRPGSRFPMTPVYEDAFRSGLGFIRIIRGGGGEIRELSLRQERVHDLRLRRVSGPLP